MKVLLINAPKYSETIDFPSNTKDLNKGSTSEGPPLGLMYVSSILKENGHETEILDLTVQKIKKREIIKKIKNEEIDMVGAALFFSTVRETLNWLKTIKNHTNVKTIVGNHLMMYYPGEIVSKWFIDYGIIGSALDSLPKLLECVEEDKTDKIKNIEGIAFREDGKVIVNYPEQLLVNTKNLPMPDIESVDISNYVSFNGDEFTNMVTSTGCKGNCTFCDLRNFDYFPRDIPNVLNEIERALDKDIETIRFNDSDFLYDRKRVKKLCKEIIRRNLNFKWWCMTRVNEVDEEILSLMKKAGCQLIWYGIESGSQKVLNNLKKGITIQQIKDAIKITDDVGITTCGFFMIGNPGETVEDIEKTIRFSKNLPLSYAQFFKTDGLKPGTPLYEQIKEHLGYDYIEKTISDKKTNGKIIRPRPWTDLTNEEIDMWYFTAFKSFYFRPKQIIKMMSNINSFTELLSHLEIGFGILTQIFKGYVQNFHRDIKNRFTGNT
ncbi:MAG: radical SAM protein [Candidatus Aenigmatarchaeota archaeon]